MHMYLFTKPQLCNLQVMQLNMGAVKILAASKMSLNAQWPNINSKPDDEWFQGIFGSAHMQRTYVLPWCWIPDRRSLHSTCCCNTQWQWMLRFKTIVCIFCPSTNIMVLLWRTKTFTLFWVTFIVQSVSAGLVIFALCCVGMFDFKNCCPKAGRWLSE